MVHTGSWYHFSNASTVEMCGFLKGKRSWGDGICNVPFSFFSIVQIGWVSGVGYIEVSAVGLCHEGS